MASSAYLALLLALLADTGNSNGEEQEVSLKKCCDVYEMLSGDGKSCVEAPWPRNASFHTYERLDFVFVPPLDAEWMHRWLPPGIPIRAISEVYTRGKYSSNVRFVSSVNASSFWGPSLPEREGLWRRTVALLSSSLVGRPRPGGGVRRADFCVDAAQPPLGPFALWFGTKCSREECAKKCCYQQEALKNNKGRWRCTRDDEGNWAPHRSSLALDPEFPTRSLGTTQGLKLSPWEFPKAHSALRNAGVMHFLFSFWKTCFDFYRDGDGSLREGLFYSETPRVTRGVFWLLRPLCILSALLLLGSIISIACNKTVRRKIHGRCLASHAACILSFNIGQIGYYIAVSDRFDEQQRLFTPPGLQTQCKYFGLWMYFLLTSSWFWLTALCINMATGFSLQVARPKKESTKRFLALAAFACGVPILMTITCSFLIAHEIEITDNVRWYNPSLAETRVCYTEFTVDRMMKPGQFTIIKSFFLKSGTALFYFGPVCCLVLGNVICLSVTLRKVQYLKRGNSVLRREGDQIPLGQRHPEGHSRPSAHTSTGRRSRNETSVDAKTIKLYIKMILMSGGIELLTEVIMWSTTVYEHEDIDIARDVGLAYRAAGYVTDFFRAAVVTWLAAPDGGYLGLLRRLRRGEGGKKKKENVA